MTLSYRGINYKHELPTVDMTEGEIGGQYRGQPWTVRYPRHIPVPQAQAKIQPKVQTTPNLKYRGVSYCPNPRQKAEACYAAPSAEVGDRISPTCENRHQVIERVEDIHLANICRRLEYRLEVAKNQGDHNLVRMLEAEFKQPVARW